MTGSPPVLMQTSSVLTFANRLDHILARLGFRRGRHRVQAGLYQLGSPDDRSPVFVTANYTLSFDALRSALVGVDGYILVLDTGGVNVWCAAAKGTFCTDELVRRIETSQLREVVKHRQLILPQLGAAGVSAHRVKQRSHFKVEYGPLRAKDLPEYLRTRTATPEMRRVTFPLAERMVLVPVELVYVFLPLLLAALLLGLLLSPLAAWGAAAAVLSGAVVFPALLPWLPARAFSLKGFYLGAAAALPFALAAWSAGSLAPWWVRLLSVLVYALGMPAVTAYLALNFTGSTPLVSHTAVRLEMKRYIPVMAAMAGLALISVIALIIYRFTT